MKKFKLPKIKITNIDKYGFQGREYHPDKDDIGKTGQVVKVETEFMVSGYADTTANINYNRYEDDAETAKKAGRGLLIEEEDYRCHVLTVAMDDGSILELMDYEVEVIEEKL